jgi:hypothetical protein
MTDSNANIIQRRWYLRNEDTGELVQGQFPATNVTLAVKNNWQEHTALSRSRAILMFINSENDQLQFSSLFFARNTDEFQDIKDRLDKLLLWAKPSLAFGRPPVLTFWVGNGFLERTCVIDGISPIAYGEPTSEGEMRRVAFTIALKAYQEFTLNDTELFETRYHRGRERDYYEMLTWREYKQPLLGDIIRKRHPEQPIVTPGAIVKLPSIEAIRKDRVETKSVQLITAYGRKSTPQRALRIDMFNRRNRTYVSHILR